MEYYDVFELWIDNQIEKGLPENSVALCFNLYEGSDNMYHVQLVASPYFDELDSEWACQIVFTSGEDVCYIPKSNGISEWQQGLKYIGDLIYLYFKKGKHKNRLLSYIAVAVGFVDGDLILLSNNCELYITAIEDYLNSIQS